MRIMKLFFPPEEKEKFSFGSSLLEFEGHSIDLGTARYSQRVKKSSRDMTVNIRNMLE